jgi:drug/metabolite transporter (DMT)-like permease
VARKDNIAPFELCVLTALAILWGAPFGLTKIGLETITPITLVAARVTIAAVVLWTIVLVIRGRDLPRRPGLAGELFAHGCLNCVVPYTLIAWGQQTVESSLATVLNSVAPIFVWLITWGWTRHEPITPARLLGIAAGLAGVISVVGIGGLKSFGQDLAGQMAILLATLSLALAVTYGRRFADIPPEVTAAGMLAWSAVVLVPLCVLLERPLSLVPSTQSLVALLINAVFSTALGFILYFRLVRTVGPMGTSSVGYLKTAVGVLIGCALLGEVFTPPLAVGLVGIAIGVVAINRRLVWPQTATLSRAA